MVLYQKTFIKLFMRLWFYVFDVPWLNSPERFLFSTSIKGCKKKKTTTNKPTKIGKARFIHRCADFSFSYNLKQCKESSAIKSNALDFFSNLLFQVWCNLWHNIPQHTETICIYMNFFLSVVYLVSFTFETRTIKVLVRKYFDFKNSHIMHLI